MHADHSLPFGCLRYYFQRLRGNDQLPRLYVTTDVWWWRFAWPLRMYVDGDLRSGSLRHYSRWLRGNDQLRRVYVAGNL